METKSFANGVSESALDHAISNKAEASDRRVNPLTKCRHLMGSWSHFLLEGNGKIMSMQIKMVKS